MSKQALLKARQGDRVTGAPPASPAARRCRRKFLRYFPGGFTDETYVEWERNYKWSAHLRWKDELPQSIFRSLLRAGRFAEIANNAIRIESKTNLLFSFEKMALRDAIKTAAGAREFAEGLFGLLHGDGAIEERFDRWVASVSRLPRRQTRVLTWPAATVFSFIAQPRIHMFMKPNVMRRAAEAYDVELAYQSRPDASHYRGLLKFTAEVRRDLADLRPRDMIDIQSFLWVLGSDEYPW